MGLPVSEPSSAEFVRVAERRVIKGLSSVVMVAKIASQPVGCETQLPGWLKMASAA